jgi:hypothetical protein
LNKENLLRAAFDFSPGISSSSIADQTRSSGQGRQDKYQDLLDAVIDARTRLAKIRRFAPMCYDILRLRFGLDLDPLRIAERLAIPLADVESLISSSIRYVCEETNEIPKVTREYVKPERSDLESGTPILILDGSLAGFKGDFLSFENSFKDRLIIRYFTQGGEQITIQNIADVDWQ